MNKKTLLVSLVLVVCAVAGMWAQDASKPAATTAVDTRLISFDLGVNIAYKVDTSALSAGATFGLGFVLTDSMKIGFLSTVVNATGPVRFNMLQFSYYINQLVGFSIGAGVGTGISGYAGLFITPIRTGSQGGIFSSLKFKLDYMFEGNAVAAGYVSFGVVSSFGL